MRKILSILEYYTRRVLPPALIVAAVMAAVEIMWIKSSVKDASADLAKIRNMMIIVFFAAMILICLLMIGPSAKKSNFMLQVRMLGASESAVYFMTVLVNLLVFLAVWGLQMVLVRFMVNTYMALPDYSYGPQGMFARIVDLRGIQIMHPMDKPQYWICGALNVCALAVCAAGFRSCRMYRKAPVMEMIIIAITAATAGYFMHDLQGAGLTYAAGSLGAAIFSLILACARFGSESDRTEVISDEEKN